KFGAFSSTTQAVRPRTNTALARPPAPLKVMTAPSRARLPSATGTTSAGAGDTAAVGAAILASAALISVVLLSGFSETCFTSGFSSGCLVSGWAFSGCSLSTVWAIAATCAALAPLLAGLVSILVTLGLARPGGA